MFGYKYSGTHNGYDFREVLKISAKEWLNKSFVEYKHWNKSIYVFVTPDVSSPLSFAFSPGRKSLFII